MGEFIEIPQSNPLFLTMRKISSKEMPWLVQGESSQQQQAETNMFAALFFPLPLAHGENL